MFGLLQSAQAAACCQLPALLQQVAPALSFAASSQRLYAQAARTSRRRGAAGAGSDAAAEGPPPSSSSSSSKKAAAAAASLHVSEAVPASAAAGSRVGKTPDPAKLSMLNDTMKKVNKQLGINTLMRLGDHASTQLDTISSGCLTLDLALGGGWARGRVVEVYGPEASGKTTLALHAVAEVQKAGGQAVFVDAEHAFNPHFARRLGVNVDDLIICQPSCGEDALEVDLVAVDSVAALLPRAELEGVIGDQQVASQARLMSYGLRKLAANAHKTNTTVMFINQLRHKIGIMFGNPETTAGGQALKFYASQRVDVRSKEKVKSGDGKVETGIRVKAKVVKNKVAPPYRSAEFIIAFNKGIDAAANLLEAGLAAGVVQAKGSYYYWDEERLGQGKDNVSTLLSADGDLMQRLTTAVKGAIQAAASEEGMGPGPAAAAAADGSESESEPQLTTA